VSNQNETDSCESAARSAGCAEEDFSKCGRDVARETTAQPAVSAAHSQKAVSPRGPTRASTLPDDPKERKKYPVGTGVMDYFPDALVAIARVSYEGNEQHNPGEPLHWARGKSMDQDDTIMRHFLERGKFDADGVRHSAKMAWRALALLQMEIEHERRPYDTTHDSKP